MFKNQIDEFLSSFPDPRPPIITKLIEANDSLRRLEIILEYFFKDSKSVKNPVGTSRKRKRDELEEFNISQSNASTPEIVHLPKRKRITFPTPFITVSSTKEHKSRLVEKSSANRKELLLSSPDTSMEAVSGTSEDEEDQEDDEEKEHQLLNRQSASPISQVLKANPEVRNHCANRLTFY